MAEADSDLRSLLNQVQMAAAELENGSSEAPEDKSQFIWNKQSTTELIQLYGKYKGLPANVKRSMIWSTISKDMKAKGFHFSSKQCENKWKHIAYNYRKFRTGDIDRKACAFFKELHEVLSGSNDSSEFVFAIDKTDESEQPSTSFDSGMDALNVPSPPPAASPQSSEASSRKRKLESTEVPPWFAEFLEEMRVRHEERMSVQREFIQLFRQGTAAMNELLMLLKKRKI